MLVQGLELKLRAIDDPEVDKVVFEKILEERDAGWIRGPIAFHELEKTVS